MASNSSSGRGRSNNSHKFIKEKNPFPLHQSMRITGTTCLDKSIFRHDNVRIVGQANCEIILATIAATPPTATTSTATPPSSSSSSSSFICKRNNVLLLVAFDQHAVHERVRYERILRDCFHHVSGGLICRKIIPPMEYEISCTLANKLINEQSILERLVGVKFAIKNSMTKQPSMMIDDDGDDDNDESKKQTLTLTTTTTTIIRTLIVYEVPQCFKAYHDKNIFIQYLHDSLRFVAKSVNHHPVDHQKVTRPKLSPFLVEQTRTTACRGAIRFGDRLMREACKQMIDALTQCRQCFRCAHGRVLVKPLCYIPSGEIIFDDEDDDDDDDDEIDHTSKQQQQPSEQKKSSSTPPIITPNELLIQFNHYFGSTISIVDERKYK